MYAASMSRRSRHARHPADGGDGGDGGGPDSRDVAAREAPPAKTRQPGRPAPRQRCCLHRNGLLLGAAPHRLQAAGWLGAGRVRFVRSGLSERARRSKLAGKRRAAHPIPGCQQQAEERVQIDVVRTRLPQRRAPVEDAPRRLSTRPRADAPHMRARRRRARRTATPSSPPTRRTA